MTQDKGQVPNKYLTVVYRDIAPGQEARELIEHPKISAASWSHALNDRDAAIAQVSTLRTAHVQKPAEIEHVAGDVSENGAEVNMSTAQPVAEATEEVENLRKALVYVAFALHDTPQHMLAQGIALIDCDTVRVSRDGWAVEASVNPHRQPAPATQQVGATKEHVRLVRVIADKIEDGTLFRSGIYSNKDLARFVRNVADAAAPQPSPTAQAAESVLVQNLEIEAPNGSGSAQCTIRWQVETPLGWVGAWSREALELLIARAPAESVTAECGNCFEGKSDFDHVCKKCRGSGKTADSVLEDAARWRWMAEYLVGPRTDLDDEIVASETVNELRKLVDADRALKEGKP